MRREVGTTCRSREAAAFSLIEILIVVAIIAILVGMLQTAVSASRQAGLRLRCASQMQGAAFQFRIFADDFAVSSRGDSERLGPGQFYADDFLDSMYHTDEFWEGDSAPRVRLDSNREHMMCPSGPGTLYRRPGRTAFEQGVWPPGNVSVAMNRRLYRNGVLPGVTRVTSRVLSHPNAPILIDVDGAAAFAAGCSPLYIAPPIARQDDYVAGQYWFPAFRHGGRLNVAFVGGHVASSRDPLAEPGWRWDYIPEP